MDFENISENSSSLYHVNPDLPSWVRNFTTWLEALGLLEHIEK